MNEKHKYIKDLVSLQERFRNLSPIEVLRLGVEEFGVENLSFATGLGKEGCVLLHMVADAGLSLDIFVLDTGLLFSETYALWHDIEHDYGLKIRAVRPGQSVQEQNSTLGDSLWMSFPDRCCERRKVEPLRRELQSKSAWVTAIRREQSAARARAQLIEDDPKFGIFKINPLAFWTSHQVDNYILKNRVLSNSLHDEGFPSIGCAPCTSAVKAGEDDRAGRWRGAQKTECGLHQLPRRRTP